MPRHEWGREVCSSRGADCRMARREALPTTGLGRRCELEEEKARAVLIVEAAAVIKGRPTATPAHQHLRAASSWQPESDHSDHAGTQAEVRGRGQTAQWPFVCVFGSLSLRCYPFAFFFRGTAEDGDGEFATSPPTPHRIGKHPPVNQVAGSKTKKKYRCSGAAPGGLIFLSDLLRKMHPQNRQKHEESRISPEIYGAACVFCFREKNHLTAPGD